MCPKGQNAHVLVTELGKEGHDDEEDEQGQDDGGKDDKGFLDEDSQVFMTNFEEDHA